MHLGLLPETGHVQRQQSQGVQLRQVNPQTLQHIMGNNAGIRNSACDHSGHVPEHEYHGRKVCQVPDVLEARTMTESYR